MTDRNDQRRLAAVIDASQRIVFFGGAGVSTESGIPDFRSEAGLYKAQREYGYRPEVILSADFFAAQPETFFRYYFENLIYPNARPNAAHRALASLERRGRLLAVVTQNIDGLHQAAGSKAVWELHGSVHRNYCVQCHRPYSLADVMNAAGVSAADLGGSRTHEAKQQPHDGQEPHSQQPHDGQQPHSPQPHGVRVPRCACGGIIRPDVVLYGEGLDSETLDGAARSVRNCDTLIIGGTSLAVYPAAGLVQLFRGDNLVLINLTKTPADQMADLVLHEPIGQALAPFARAL
ncbi:NAD-dependent deacylase [Rarobacter incanus]|nr:NAD-dependent deacylase [Rarobacter incanus]